MSQLWQEALAQAYPEQEPRYRPSGIGNCGLEQAAKVHRVGKSNPQPGANLWQAEMGRAGQDIVMRVLPYLGFKIKKVIKERIDVEGNYFVEEVADTPSPEGAVLPGEADSIVEVLPNNPFNPQLEPGPMLIDIKVRNVYAYNHVLQGIDLMTEDPGIGLQMQTYLGDHGIERGMIVLLPHDIYAVVSDRRFGRAKVLTTNTRVRFLMFRLNPELYALAVERKLTLEKHGLSIAPEYNPYQGKNPNGFPCFYSTGGCEWLDWCRHRFDVDTRTDKNRPMMPMIPDEGMPLLEVELP